jgi:queuosine biosynthesis protein QueC
MRRVPFSETPAFKDFVREALPVIRREIANVHRENPNGWRLIAKWSERILIEKLKLWKNKSIRGAVQSLHAEAAHIENGNPKVFSSLPEELRDEARSYLGSRHLTEDPPLKPIIAEHQTRTIVLLSGGMDSVALLYHAFKEHEVLAALSFDYGSKHNPQEIPFAKKHAAQLGLPHHTVRLDFVNELFESNLLSSGGDIPDGHYEEATMKQTVVPFRNGIMLSIAAGFAESVGASAAVIAAHAGDHAIYPDCREEFMQSGYCARSFILPRLRLPHGGTPWVSISPKHGPATRGAQFTVAPAEPALNAGRRSHWQGSWTPLTTHVLLPSRRNRPSPEYVDL